MPMPPGYKSCRITGIVTATFDITLWIRENMHSSKKSRIHWRNSRTLTMWLLTIWFIVTFMVSAFARELQSISVLGLPLPFYMGTQGALLVYLVLVAVFAWRMGKLDDEYSAE